MKNYFYRLTTDQEKGFAATVVKAFLLLFSFPYEVMVRFVRGLHSAGILKTHRLPKPVISIGNLTWGGAGKTPMVELVAEFCKQKRLKPVILIRGYMGMDNRGISDHDAISDEALLLEASLRDVPVLIGHNRVNLAKAALKNREVDVFLLDDGFQHWRLYRNLDIVLIDTMNPVGNGQLIPRGILREPFSALGRAQVIVLTRTDKGQKNIPELRKWISRASPKALIAETVHQPVALLNLRGEKTHRDLSEIKGKPIAAFCAIGNPQSFASTLRDLGADLRHLTIFMDHHLYMEKDIAKINDYCLQKKIDTIVTTEKDAVKLDGLLNGFSENLNVLSLKIKIRFTQGQDEFYKRITDILPR